MNNDTPQVFGEDTHGYPHSADSDDGEDFPAFRGWAGWGDRVEPVAPDDYPPPSFSGYEAQAGYEPGYAGRPGPGQPGYPAGPGYAPEPGYERGLAYAPGMSYDEPGVSYAPAYGYPRELGFAEDPGYGGGTASGAGAVPVPPMEQLPDSDEFFGIAIPVAGDLELRSDARPEPDLVPEAGGAAEPAAARGLAAPPIRVIPAPVAALPEEATQSWSVAQSWEREEAPDEGDAWHEAGEIGRASCRERV